MHPWPEKLHAVEIGGASRSGTPLVGSLQATMESPAYKAISRMMASTALEVKLKAAGKLTVAEIDRAIGEAARPLSMPERIELKQALSRMGLLG